MERVHSRSDPCYCVWRSPAAPRRPQSEVDVAEPLPLQVWQRRARMLAELRRCGRACTGRTSRRQCQRSALASNAGGLPRPSGCGAPGLKSKAHQVNLRGYVCINTDAEQLQRHQ